MIAAIVILSLAVLILSTFLFAGWWQLGRHWPDTLDEEQAAQNGRPLVGAKILKFAAEDATPPLEDEA